jgi:hypothetical protein
MAFKEKAKVKKVFGVKGESVMTRVNNLYLCALELSTRQNSFLMKFEAFILGFLCLRGFAELRTSFASFHSAFVVNTFLLLMFTEALEVNHA